MGTWRSRRAETTAKVGTLISETSDSTYGEWRIVETRVSPLTGRRTAYEPIATQASLVAENLACHWRRTMHTFDLSDKLLERADIVKILGILISRRWNPQPCASEDGAMPVRPAPPPRDP